MSTAEIIAVTIFGLAIIAAITIISVYSLRSPSRSHLAIDSRRSPDSNYPKWETKTIKKPADSKEEATMRSGSSPSAQLHINKDGTVKNTGNTPSNKTVFSVATDEAKVVEKALEKHREAKEEKDLGSYEERLAEAIKEGIKTRSEDSLEAARSGDVSAVKETLDDLDWLEEFFDSVTRDIRANRRQSGRSV